jgi:hypothetical protein
MLHPIRDFADEHLSLSPRKSFPVICPERRFRESLFIVSHRPTQNFSCIGDRKALERLIVLSAQPARERKSSRLPRIRPFQREARSLPACTPAITMGARLFVNDDGPESMMFLC